MVGKVGRLPKQQGMGKRLAENPYRVEVSKGGCERCGHGRMWDIVGPDKYAIGQSFGDEEFANDLAEHMNMAYEAGREMEAKRG